MRTSQVYGDGEVEELLSLKYAIVLMQRENRMKRKKIHRSLQTQLEWQTFQMKERERDGEKYFLSYNINEK